MVKKLSGLFFVLIFGLHGSQALAIEVTAQVDRNPVIVNESFTLTITANEDLPQSTFRPDTLMDDFVVGATSVDRSTRLIQGDLSRQTRWQVSLVAREPGTYQIPAFELNGAQTDAIELNVIKPDTDAQASRGPVFITAEVDNHEPYLQQQIRYVVKLHIAHQLESGTLSPPVIEHGDIQQVGRDEESQQIINGMRYRVITRTYLITPQRSGSFTLEGSRFDGQVREQQPRSFTGFSRPQSVTVMADDIELDVQARPDNYNHHWLPSQHVVLEDEWDEDQQLTLGEPVSRRITLTAQGVRAEQLPEVDVQYPANLRYYPERTERESFSAQGQRIAQATFRGALIPAQAGEFTIPETVVHWWNTQTDRHETARLPARTVTVVEPAGGLQSLSSETTDESASEAASFTDTGSQSAQNEWWSPAATLFSILWVITLFVCVWLWLRPRATERTKDVVAAGQVPGASRKPLQRLKLACQKNDAKAARKELLNWANSRHPETQVNDLDSLATEFGDAELSIQVAHLQRALYSGRDTDWQTGGALWQSIQRLHQRARQQTSDGQLPRLYPTS